MSKMSWYIMEYVGDGWYTIYVKFRRDDAPYCWSNDYTSFNSRTKELIIEYPRESYKGIC